MRGASLLLALTTMGCVSYPAPTAHFATASASTRAARDVGALALPLARLHVTMAEEAIAKAGALMDRGENERADYMTLRAYNDAELALALTREDIAKHHAEAAAEKVRAIP